MLQMLQWEENQCMTLVMADTKFQNVHVRLTDEEAEKFDAIIAARFGEGLRDRTKALRVMIEEEYERCQRRQGGAKHGVADR
jgi:hypothetical protein